MPKKGMALSLLFLALFMSLVYVFSGPNKFSQTSYSDFMNALDQGQVSEVTISHDGTGNHNINGIKDGVPFQAEIILTDELMSLLQDKGVKVDVKKPNVLISSILINLLGFVLIFGLIYFVFIRQMRNAGKGAMSFGKSRARLLNKDKNKITFDRPQALMKQKKNYLKLLSFLKIQNNFKSLVEKCQRVFCYAVRLEQVKHY